MGNILLQTNGGAIGFSADIPSIYRQRPLPSNGKRNRRDIPGFDFLNKKVYNVLHESYPSDIFKFGVRRQGVFSSEVGFNLHNKEGFSKHSLIYPVKFGPSCDLDLSTIINSNKEFVPSITIRYSGAMVSISHSFNTLNEEKSLQVESKYKSSVMNVGLDFNFNFNSLAPMIRAEGMLNIEGWLTGISTTFDSTIGESVSYSFVFGDEDGNVCFNSCLSDKEKFKETVYFRVSENLHTALSVAWSSRENSSCVSVGCKYELPSNFGTLGVKLNNFGVLSLSKLWRPMEGVQTIMSCSVRKESLVECGFGIELEI